MNGLFNPTKVPVKVSVSKLYPVSKGTMTSLIGCSETVDFLIRESRISLSFTVNNPFINASVYPMYIYYFLHLDWRPNCALSWSSDSGNEFRCKNITSLTHILEKCVPTITERM